MKFAAIIAIALALAACTASQTAEPDRVRLKCEWGCPALLPFVNILPVFPIKGDSDTTSCGEGG